MNQEVENLLNALADAERAGGRVLHELTPMASNPELRAMLKKVGHDEGYYAGELLAQTRRLGGNPSNKTGDFVEKVRAVPDFIGKLKLLNRGQSWVVRKIREGLPNIGDDELKGFLLAMAAGHEMSIGALDRMLEAGAK